MNLMNLLRHVSLKHARLQKAQLLIAICGISLGVASMVSIDIVSRSVLHSFEASINHVTGRAALQISAGEIGFPEKLLDLVQNVPGVEQAAPVIETNANLGEGSGRSIMILGVDVLQDHKIRSYSLTDETADIPDPLLFLAKADSILLTRAMAEREGIAIDQPIRLQTVQGMKTFYARGLLNPEGPARVAGGEIAVMDIFAAQMAFGKGDRIDRIDVSLLPGQDLDVMKERLQRALPQGYAIDTPTARSRQVEILLSRFRKSMGFISFMALFVGMYLIYNAVSISIVQRRKEIGILRALGAQKYDIMKLFLAETLSFSAVGSLVGVALGALFAKLTIGIVAQTITDLYIRTSVDDLTLSWLAIGRSFGVGILASLVAAFIPAVSSSRIAPVSAIRSPASLEVGFSSNRKTKAASIVCLFLSILSFTFYQIADSGSIMKSPIVPLGSAFLLIPGISLFTPVFLDWLTGFAHRSLSFCFGAAGRIASTNMKKNISRNAVAVAAVLYSIALFVSSANSVNSLSMSIFDWVDSIIRADLLVSSGHPLAGGGSPTIPMPSTLMKEMEEVPGVLSVEPFRKGFVAFRDRRVLLETFDVAHRMAYCPVMITAGRREDMLRLLPHKDNVVINEAIAAKYGISPGDSIALPTPDGLAQFGVAAVVVSYTSDAGVIWMDTHTYQRHWRDSLIDTIEVRVKPNEDIQVVREAILDRFGKERKLFTLPARELKEEIYSTLNRAFTLNNAINIITLIIAGLGIVVTLLASVIERTREIGILRSIGMKRSQVTAIVIIESTLIGAAGWALGSACGMILGWIELESFFKLDYGSSIAYHVHYPSLLWALLLSVGFSALAGFYPARRASRINIVEALSYE